MKKIIVMYHKFCRDGYCAAAVAYLYFRKLEKAPRAKTEVTFMPVIAGAAEEAVNELIDRYGNLAEDVRVFAFDLTFGYSAAAMLFKHFPNSRVYDHHETTAECFERPKGVSAEEFKAQTEIFNEKLTFDTRYCGAMLAYHALFPHRKVPTLVKYIEDYDLWKWREPDSRDINAGLYEMLSMNYIPGDDSSSTPESNIVFNGMDGMIPDFNDWVHCLLYDDWIEEARMRGALINKITSKNAKRQAKSGKVREIDGLQVAIVNATTGISETGEYFYIKEMPEGETRPASVPQNSSYVCDYVLMWRYDHNTDSCFVSMRSRQGSSINVQEIAKRVKFRGRSGGGHPNAAGFEIDIATLFRFFREGMSVFT